MKIKLVNLEQTLLSGDVMGLLEENGQTAATSKASFLGGTSNIIHKLYKCSTNNYFFNNSLRFSYFFCTFQNKCHCIISCSQSAIKCSSFYTVNCVIFYLRSKCSHSAGQRFLQLHTVYWFAEYRPRFSIMGSHK